MSTRVIFHSYVSEYDAFDVVRMGEMKCKVVPRVGEHYRISDDWVRECWKLDEDSAVSFDMRVFEVKYVEHRVTGVVELRLTPPDSLVLKYGAPKKGRV